MNLDRKIKQRKAREHDIEYALIFRPYTKLICIKHSLYQELSPSTHNNIPNLNEKLNT